MLPNREELLERVSEAVRRAGALFGDRELAEQIRRKGVTDFVTQVDLTVQEQLRGALRAIAPEVQFMGEEQDNSGLDFGGAVWILDPVDGTMNLIHGFRHSAVSLALAEGGEVTMALVYDPFADELFTALAGRGARCNGRPIAVSGAERLADALVDVGTNPSEREKADRMFRWMRGVYDRCHDVRRMGAASLCLAYVAAGRLDAYVEDGLKPWDYAAGMLLVREAGGMAATPERAEPSLEHGGGIAAANRRIGPDFLKLLSEA